MKPTVLIETIRTSKVKINSKAMNSNFVMNLGSRMRVTMKMDANQQNISKIFSKRFQSKLSARFQLNIIIIEVITHIKNDFFSVSNKPLIKGSLCRYILHPIAAMLKIKEIIRQGILVEFSFMWGSSMIPINILAMIKNITIRNDSDLTVYFALFRRGLALSMMSQ